MFLEYRLLDEKKDYPTISYYENISREEILLRFQCDYLVKGRKVYEKISTSSEGHSYVIYVELDLEESGLDVEYVFQPNWKGIKVEFRHFQEGESEHPLIKEYIYTNPQDALLHLTTDYYELDGREWLKISSEIDENTKSYVYYAKPTA